MYGRTRYRPKVSVALAGSSENQRARWLIAATSPNRRSWSAFGPYEAAKRSAMVSTGEHRECLSPLMILVFAADRTLGPMLSSTEEAREVQIPAPPRLRHLGHTGLAQAVPSTSWTSRIATSASPSPNRPGVSSIPVVRITALYPGSKSFFETISNHRVVFGQEYSHGHPMLAGSFTARLSRDHAFVALTSFAGLPAKMVVPASSTTNPAAASLLPTTDGSTSANSGS